MQHVEMQYIGMLIYFLGLIGKIFGTNLQRYSVIKEIENDTRRSKIKQKWWLCGFTIFLISNILTNVALFFSNKNQIASMHLFIFLFNLLIGRLINNEIVYFIHCLSTFLIIICFSIFIISEPQIIVIQNNTQVYNLIFENTFYIYCVLISIILLIALLLRYILLKQTIISQAGQNTVSVIYAFLPGFFSGINKVSTSIIFYLLGTNFEKKIFFSSMNILLYSILIIGFIIQNSLTVKAIDVCSPIIIISTIAVIEKIISAMGNILILKALTNSITNWILFIGANIISVIGLYVLIKNHQNR